MEKSRGNQAIAKQSRLSGKVLYLSSGFPFLTVARHISPTEQDGRRFRHAPQRCTAMMYRFFAPLLSQQLITAPTFKPWNGNNIMPKAISELAVTKSQRWDMWKTINIHTNLTSHAVYDQWTLLFLKSNKIKPASIPPDTLAISISTLT